MNIAYVLLDPGIGVFGTKGASVHVQEMIRAFRADGHHVEVHCTRTGDDIPADLADLTVHHHPLPPKTDAARREKATAATSSIIAAEIAAAAAAPGRSVDLVYERYSLFSTAGAELAQELGIPFILEVNAPLIAEQSGHRILVDRAGAEAATERSLTAATAVSCVSPAVAQWASGIAEPERVVVTPNGVNTDRIRPRWERRDLEAPLTVGFVGTLKPWHGTDVAIRALARTQQPMRMEICGTGPEQPALAELAANLGVADRVTFHGAVAPERMPQQLTRMDLALAPYPPGDQYFSPLKIYEYLAAGLPVVASANGTVPDLLDHGRTGVLVTPGDIDELAAVLDELALDPARRDLLGARARDAAVDRHDWRHRMRDLLDHPLMRPAGAPDAAIHQLRPTDIEDRWEEVV